MEYKNGKEEKFKLAYVISLVTQIGLTVSVTVGIFILLGRFFDNHFGTAPIFTLLGLFLSLIVSMYEVYRLVLPVLESKKKQER